MHWKLKAALQNAVARLPEAASYATYYWLQRHWGGLRRLDPLPHLHVGLAIGQRLLTLGSTPRGKVFVEVGTGRVPLLPIAFWLMGAKHTYTFDRHPYLKAELVAESLVHIADHCEALVQHCGALIVSERLLELAAFARQCPGDLDALGALCRIEYLAPADAAATGLPAQSIDVHTSYTVLEHIPPPVLTAILKEGARLLRPDGWGIHGIDYSDHFAHGDPRLSPLHFLRYSDKQWARYADNKYMYMNRLRHDDMLRLFEETGHRIVDEDPQSDLGMTEVLPLDARFQAKSAEVLAITQTWVITQAADAHPTDEGNVS
jgi:SAM-dependent methyltransferase